MDIPTKKLNSGFEIPVIALGTWGMGGYFEKGEYRSDENNKDIKKDIEAIRKAYELGMRRFDTAESYAQGYSEEILGQALKDFDRKSFFITSKVYWTNLRYENVLNSCKESLKRLGMDYIDLYLIHGPDPDVPIKETMKALNELKEQGLIRNIGVSNFNIERLEEAQKYCNSKIVLNQVHYNLLFREPVLKGVLDYCQKNDIFLEAWRPLQQGLLTKTGIKIVDDTCVKYNRTPAQIALNWLISQNNVLTLFKTSKIDRLKENLEAITWKMDKKDIEKLSKEFPYQLDRSNAVQLK